MAGRRVLVVEDEMTVAMGLEMALAGIGCVVVGPVGRMAQAVDLAKTEVLDAAVLDINIRGDEVYPVAEILSHRGIPFAFLSGYGRLSFPAFWLAITLGCVPVGAPAQRVASCLFTGKLQRIVHKKYI
jgi:CheY-like chemotaxis protein